MNGHGEPHAAEPRQQPSSDPRQRGGRWPPQPGAEDSERLPGRQSEHDPQHHSPVQRGRADRDARVGECEQRHDDERGDRMQRVLEALERRNHALARVAEGEQRVLLSLARQRQQVAGFGPVELIEQLARFRGEFGRVDARPGGDGQRQRHARNGRMDPRLVHEKPQHGRPARGTA